MNKYVDIRNRVYVDIDNDRVFDYDIVKLSRLDEIEDYSGNRIELHENDYIYMYTDNIEDNEHSYIYSEGIVIRNPYNELSSFKWFCKLIGDIEYLKDYNNRFVT